MMKTLPIIIVALIIFCLFMLPGVVMLWLVMLKDAQFNGDLVLFVMIMFCLGCMLEVAILERRV